MLLVDLITERSYEVMLNTIPENMIEKAVSELKETNVLKYIWGGGNAQEK